MSIIMRTTVNIISVSLRGYVDFLYHLDYVNDACRIA